MLIPQKTLGTHLHFNGLSLGSDSTTLPIEATIFRIFTPVVVISRGTVVALREVPFDIERKSDMIVEPVPLESEQPSHIRILEKLATPLVVFLVPTSDLTGLVILVSILLTFVM